MNYKKLLDSLEEINLPTPRIEFLKLWLQYKLAPSKEAIIKLCLAINKLENRVNTRLYYLLHSKYASYLGKKAVDSLIVTPLGVFSGVVEAARAHGLRTRRAVIQKCSSKELRYRDWYRLAVPIRGSDPNSTHLVSAKEVVTPHGVFQSTKEADRKLGLARGTTNQRVRSKKPWFKGWYYTEKVTALKWPPAARSVHTPLGDFNSIRSAARAEKMSHVSLRDLLESGTSLDYYYN